MNFAPRLWLVPTLFAMLAASAQAQIVANGDKYTFHANYAAGHVNKYVADVSLGALGASLDVLEDVTMNVKSVDAGVATGELTFGEFSIPKGGKLVKQALDILKKQGGKFSFMSPHSQKFHLDGCNRAQKPEEDSPIFITLPDHPVEIGDSWDGNMGSKIKFAGVLDRDGHKVALLQSQQGMGGVNLTLSAEFTLADGNMESAMISAMPDQSDPSGAKMAKSPMGQINISVALRRK